MKLLLIHFNLKDRNMAYYMSHIPTGASLVAQLVKNLPAMQETQFNPWVGKIPWRRAWQPTPVFLPGESPWTEESGRLQSMWSQVSDTT